MKKTLFAVTCAGLMLPTLALAAYNDITLSTDTVLSVGGVTVNVSSASTLESLTVGSTSFTVSIPVGATVEVTAPGLNTLNVDASNSAAAQVTCTSALSKVVFTGVDGGSVTITPSSALCGASSSSSAAATGGNGPIASGGGGGGGGSIIPTAIVPQAAATASVSSTASVTQTTTVQATKSAQTFAPLSASAFRGVKVGTSNSQFKTLQQMLNSDPDTQVAGSGVGSAGHETNFFGPLTRKAVEKFQTKYGIVSSGTPTTTGYGNVGPKTRAKLNELFGK